MNPRQRRSSGVTEAFSQPAVRLADENDTPDSFEALYRRTMPRVYAYASSLLHDGGAAEEVTALAFERAYRKRASFRPGRGSADAWLFGIVRNAALDELRRRRRRATLSADPEDAAAMPAEEHAERVLRRETVRAALATLDGRERDLIALKFDGGLTSAEIGRVLGISESNATTRLHRAIEKLRRACDERG